MKRSENLEVNRRFGGLLQNRNDLRIGQMIYNALKKRYRGRIDDALFVVDDLELIQLIGEMFWGWGWEQ